MAFRVIFGMCFCTCHAAQAVVQNLMISRIEFRDDTDPDVVKYSHPRSREQRLVPVCQEGRLIRQLLRKLMTPLAMRLNSEAEVGAVCAAESVHLFVESLCRVHAHLFANMHLSVWQPCSRVLLWWVPDRVPGGAPDPAAAASADDATGHAAQQRSRGNLICVTHVTHCITDMRYGMCPIAMLFVVVGVGVPAYQATAAQADDTAGNAAEQ
jgi:hypothetical protein